MLKRKKIKEVFDNTSGIFAALDTLTMPWSEDQTALPLDIIYNEEHSGEKWCAPMVLNRLNDQGDIPAEGMSVLAVCLKGMYYSKWSALWELVNSEYNPIENYNMVEDGSDELKKTGTDTNLKTGSLDHSGALTRTGSLAHSGALTRTGSLEHSGALTRTGSLDRSGALITTGSVADSGDVTKTGKETTKVEFTSEGDKTTTDNLEYVGKDKTVDTLEYLGKEKTSGTQANNEDVKDESIYGYNSSQAQPSSHAVEKASHEDIKEFYDDRQDKRTIEKEYLNDRADNRTVTESHSADFKDTTDTDHEYVNVKDTTSMTKTYNNLAETDSRKETYNNIADTDSRKETYNNIADTDSRTETYNNIADTDTRKETYNDITDQLTHNTSDKNTHHLTRSGNIGVTTTQQMALQELEFRRWRFFDEVMNDIDSMLTLRVY